MLTPHGFRSSFLLHRRFCRPLPIRPPASFACQPTPLIPASLSTHCTLLLAARSRGTESDATPRASALAPRALSLLPCPPAVLGPPHHPRPGGAYFPTASSLNPAHWEITPAPLHADSFFSEPQVSLCTPTGPRSLLTPFQGHSHQSAADAGLPPSSWNPRSLLACFGTDCLPGSSPPPASPPPCLLDPRPASSVISRPAVPLPLLSPKRKITEKGCSEESSQNLNASF